MKGHSRHLLHEVLRGGLILLLMACAGPGTAVDNEPISVAVWDLEDLSPVAHGQAGIGEFMAATITERVSEMERYRAVERQQLLKAIEELNIGSSDLADAGTRLKLGRIIGARQMVFGAFQVVGASLRLDLRRIDVASGKVLKTSTGTASSEDASGWLLAADQAAAELMRP